MRKKIERIGQLVNTDAFLQVDLIKGFKYIDKAGEIVNLYTDSKPPQFQMALSQLVLEEPVPNLAQLKVSSNVVWAKVADPGSLEVSYQNFTHEVAKIVEVLEVSKVSRIGWRNHFALEFDSPEEAKLYLANLVITNIPGCNLSVAKLDLKTATGIEGALMLQEVAKNDDKSTHAIMFDIDLFKKGPIDVANIGKTLLEFRDFLGSATGFLAIINHNLS